MGHRMIFSSWLITESDHPYSAAIASTSTIVRQRLAEVEKCIMSQQRMSRDWDNQIRVGSNASDRSYHSNPPRFPGAQMSPNELNQYPPQVLITSTALTTMSSRELTTPLTQMNDQAERVSRLHRDMVKSRNSLLAQVEENRKRAAECQAEWHSSQQLTQERVKELETWIKQYDDTATHLQREVAKLDASLQKIATEMDRALRDIGLLPSQIGNASSRGTTRYIYPTSIADANFRDNDPGTSASGSSSQAGQYGQGDSSYGSQY